MKFVNRGLFAYVAEFLLLRQPESFNAALCVCGTCSGLYVYILVTVLLGIHRRVFLFNFRYNVL
jgi:hypothetical protein